MKKTLNNMVDETVRKIQPVNSKNENTMSDIEDKFNNSRIEQINENYNNSLDKLIKQIEEDLTVPTRLSELINYNLGIGLLNSKYMREYSKVLKKHETLSHRLQVLDSSITQQYARDHSVNNGVIVSKEEVKNLVIIDKDRVSLKEELIRVAVLLDMFSKAIKGIEGLPYRVRDQIEMIKILGENY